MPLSAAETLDCIQDSFSFLLAMGATPPASVFTAQKKIPVFICIAAARRFPSNRCHNNHPLSFFNQFSRMKI